ncbi:PIG-L deacetylase family protein, partial [Pseudactinotalea suaedae]
MNILAVGAHPDDIECFCSGTLLRYRAAGHRIFLALTTSGNAGSNVIPTTAEVAATREAEQLVAARGYDAEVRFLRFDDQGLHDTPQTRRAVRSAIRWANPDVILTNPPWDMSTDHAVTGKLVADLMLSLGGNLHPSDVPPITKAPSLFFWDIAAGLRFDPEAYVDISEHAEQKASLINTHKS